MLDFDKEFSSFIEGTEGSSIRDIYSIIPSLNQSQIRILSEMEYFAEKYNLQEIKAFIERYLKMISTNKNLSFLSSMNMKSLLKAYTQDELIRGIKVQSQINQAE
ncbi:MAG: hypothetical protein QXI16_05445 [Sulfolobaceae archaeon]